MITCSDHLCQSCALRNSSRDLPDLTVLPPPPHRRSALGWRSKRDARAFCWNVLAHEVTALASVTACMMHSGVSRSITAMESGVVPTIRTCRPDTGNAELDSCLISNSLACSLFTAMNSAVLRGAVADCDTVHNIPRSPMRRCSTNSPAIGAETHSWMGCGGFGMGATPPTGSPSADDWSSYDNLTVMNISSYITR